MHSLYVNGHPDADSFHAAIEQHFCAAFERQPHGAHELRVLDLGAQHFDPVLRFGYHRMMPDDPEISLGQRSVHWADHIVFAFPVWWGDAPALMKGWVERVFTPGFSYSFRGASIDHLLAGRTADIIMTQRGLSPLNWVFGNHAVGIFRHNIGALTGIRIRRVITLGGVGLGGRFDASVRRERFLHRVERHAQTLASARRRADDESTAF